MNFSLEFATTSISNNIINSLYVIYRSLILLVLTSMMSRMIIFFDDAHSRTLVTQECENPLIGGIGITRDLKEKIHSQSFFSPLKVNIVWRWSDIGTLGVAAQDRKRIIQRESLSLSHHFPYWRQWYCQQVRITPYWWYARMTILALYSIQVENACGSLILQTRSKHARYMTSENLFIRLLEICWCHF